MLRDRMSSWHPGEPIEEKCEPFSFRFRQIALTMHKKTCGVLSPRSQIFNSSFNILYNTSKCAEIISFHVDHHCQSVREGASQSPWWLFCLPVGVVGA